MAEQKQSTKAENSNTVEPKREIFVPEYGITVEASSIEEAVEEAKKRNKQEQDKQ